ncbi:hypothetical protein LGL08_22795 [Clostridium estertheticum]|uniref:hypothetical protein n=1 Tax=Clostridium estertheticum TaxID=238834 RepID=UPI001CF12F4E|nr:hypothetical protein [Clostridium estertheticum]MCB2309375.1 hypothetical protein [Clostridium estertheticum]MCB2347811.1 hypothetical protein [Clostridium estertheticum]MCB2352343.1 hypothetical protein [Clostridium estertheticum]WAG44910.1 hypothetical protein LL127_15305 [Clostridium estertheticum]
MSTYENSQPYTDCCKDYYDRCDCCDPWFEPWYDPWSDPWSDDNCCRKEHFNKHCYKEN